MNSGNVAITRFDLDWVCITQRAADNDPHSQLLWVQAALAISDTIAAFNSAAIDEAHAAHAQLLIGRLAIYAVETYRTLYSGTPLAVASERIKDQLMHIARGGEDPRALV